MFDRTFRRVAGLVVLGFTLAWSTPAWAGEVKFGTQPLETDDQGNLTSAGREAAVTEVEGTPGESLWNVHLWAKIDRGANGPMYVELTRQWQGKRVVVERFEDAGYQGDKFFSMDLQLEGGGYKSGETYNVELIQVIGNRDKKHTSAKLKLLASSKPAPAPEPEPEPEAEPEPEPEPEETGNVGDEGNDAAPAGPPPVEPGSQKGCSIGQEGGGPPALLLLAALPRQRRRHR